MNKNNQRIIKLLGVFFLVLLILSSISLSYSILLYKGIETFYRIMAIIIIIYLNLLFIYNEYLSIKNKSFKRFIATSVISVVFISLFFIGSYLIYSVYNKINSFNKNSVTYTTVLLSFNENYNDINKIKNIKIGMINDEKNYELYILPEEVISKHSLDKNNEIVTYSSSLELISALYHEEIDVIFISSNYVDLFSNLEEYEDIEDKSIEAFKYSKEFDKSKIEKEETSSNEKLLTEPFTILLLGVDSEKKELNKNAAFNGDTIMLVSFNPNTLQAIMFSIPRDTYVPISCSGNKLKKINTSAYGGTKCVIKTVENFTNIDIDYYVKINFKGIVNLVDNLGGINVDVPYSFCEQNSDRKFGKNTIYVKKGIQKLNGEQALALARNRHTYIDKCGEEYAQGTRNDFIRGKNQQLVVEGILNQAKTINNVSSISSLLDAISKSIDTNLSTAQILSFYDVIKSLMFSKENNILNIEKTRLRGYDARIYDTTAKGERYAFFNWKGSLKDITTAIKETLGLKKISLIKSFSFSINKNYEKTIIGDKNYSESKITLVPNFKSYSINKAKEWAHSKGLDFHIKDYTTSADLNLSSYQDYSIVSQKENPKTMVSAINSITIYVTKLSSTHNEEPEESTDPEIVEPETIE